MSQFGNVEEQLSLVFLVRLPERKPALNARQTLLDVCVHSMKLDETYDGNENVEAQFVVLLSAFLQQVEDGSERTKRQAGTIDR